MLFKPQVRTMLFSYMAGCERVFFEDAKHFIDRRKLTQAYVASDMTIADSKYKKHFRILWYPHAFIDTVDTLDFLGRYRGVRRIYFRLKFLLYFFCDLLYALQFLYFARNDDTYYIFEQPFVALLFPSKTVLAYHNFYNNIIWFRLFPKCFTVCKIIFPSKSLYDQFAHAYPLLPKTACHVLFNGVDTAKFHAKQAKDQHTITFLYASSWHPLKGISVLEDVIIRINRTYKKRVQFIIGGSPDLWSLTMKEKKHLTKLTNRIQNLSKRYNNVLLKKTEYDDMPALYNQATYCLFPSVWKDPCPLVILESLACGTPVITFTCGGASEIIKNNVNGFLVQKIDKNAFYNTVKEVLINVSEQTYQRVAKNAVTISKQYSSQHRFNRLENLLYAM